MLDFLLKRNPEVRNPPPSLDDSRDKHGPSVPATYAFVQRREPHMGPTFLAGGEAVEWDYKPNDTSHLEVSSYQDAPDVIRQSVFWNAGRKVNPWARNTRPSHLNIASILSHMIPENRVGKLIGYRQVSMYSRTQLPSQPRSNINMVAPTTYGSMLSVQGGHPSSNVKLGGGMAYTQYSIDGYPY